ncbi:hypothetical protein GCM10012285_19670 [Streptomyces kronopolitis]|uniref:DUF3592 domain-containing protein n=1 Tax=Streptomyces kronopolitis TaxID=1612435 RepID=A0ABQ2JAA7_9ACTN|nr:hypothetical protein [Streptomyces kronopolitis]GGN40971.1 hypothetical protein GCM10012285_19670 [Streptomyces kronopolitis]
MSSADHTATRAAPALRRVSAGPRRAGTWLGAWGLAAALSVLPLWLFWPDPQPRRTAILVALGCALACVGGIAVCRRAAGGRRPYAAISVAEFSGGTAAGGPDAVEPDGPPRVLPSRRGMQARSLAWYLGVCTVLVTLFALVTGAPQRPERMQRIVDAGAEFAVVPIEKAGDVRLHDPSKGHDYYTSTAVVRLAPKAGGRPVAATVQLVTPDRPHAGGKASVLYAPTRPGLGAVAGDERSLGDALDGATMGTGRVWIIGVAWAAGIVLSVVVLSVRRGFRSFSRLGPADRAVRGKCLGPDLWRRDSAEEQCLKIVTASSRTAHFLADVTEEHVPDSLTGQHLWLCWDARRGAGGGRFSAGATPAALVSDDGWVMHGMLKADDAQMLAGEGIAVEKTVGGNSEPRPLRLWDPHSAWLLYVAPSALVLGAVLIGCAALLTFDITGVWRWATGIAGAVAGLALGHVAMNSPYPSAVRSAMSSNGADPA